jgi:ATP-dependent DNA ligase
MSLRKLRLRSCIIDGEAVACGEDRLSSFDRIRHRDHDASVFMWTFDLIECGFVALGPTNSASKRSI